MNRAERRRQERENRKNEKTGGSIYSVKSPSVPGFVQQILYEHEGHSLAIEEDFQSSLTLRCEDCEDQEEDGEGKVKVERRTFV